MEIYLNDLKEEIQTEVLNFLNSDKNDNWDITPLFILESEAEESEEIKVLRAIEEKIKQKQPLTNVEHEIYSSQAFR